MKNYLSKMFWGPSNYSEFIKGIQLAINQLAPQGIFTGDNMFTFGKNLSFLDDERFITAFTRHVETEAEKSVIWRMNTLCWAARQSLRIAGDFVECACYKGMTARIVSDYVDLGNTDKQYYLYDLFEHSSGMDHHEMPEHSEDLYERVKHRFADLPQVLVTKGFVPDVLHQIAPDKIAFLHLDLNSVSAEIGVLELLFDRVSTGGIIVLDDYGWLAYRAQKEAEDTFFEERGYRVLELPTGQGLIVK